VGRAGSRHRPSRNHSGDRAWKLAFDALGADRDERRRISGWIALSYPVVAGLMAGVLAAVVVLPVLGVTGAVVAAIVVGSFAFEFVAQRTHGPRG
jgi:hypothetical protein